MVTHKADLQVFDTEVNRVFGDLQRYGFAFSPATIASTPALGEYIEIIAARATPGLKLLFHYLPPEDPRREVITIFLENRGDCFSIDEYLFHKKIDPAVSESIEISSYSGPMELRVSRCLEAAKKVLLLYLKGTLLGSDWEHIPFDWMGYK